MKYKKKKKMRSIHIRILISCFYLPLSVQISWENIIFSLLFVCIPCCCCLAVCLYRPLIYNHPCYNLSQESKLSRESSSQLFPVGIDSPVITNRYKLELRKKEKFFCFVSKEDNEESDTVTIVPILFFLFFYTHFVLLSILHLIMNVFPPSVPV